MSKRTSKIAEAQNELAKDMILAALENHGYSIKDAANSLNVSAGHFPGLMEKHGVKFEITIITDEED